MLFLRFNGYLACWRVLLFGLCLLLGHSQSHAQDSLPQQVLNVSSKFKSTMIDCPERIWPNFSWQGFKVVFVYPSATHSWQWDASTDSIIKIKNTSLPASALGSTYEFFKIQGRPALSLHMDQDMSEADVFEFGAHEFFHDQGQIGWTVSGSGRGTDYPVEWQPRLYRRMLFDNLKRHLSSGADTDLRKARFWFDKWKTEFPDEHTSATDGYEGTAEYFEMLASAISRLGCEATDAQLKAMTTQEVNSDDFSSSVSGKQLALDAEGYTLGGLASLILRFKQDDQNVWTQKVTKGISPVEQVVQMAPATDETAPSELVQKFHASAVKINQDWGRFLDKDISNWINKNYVRVALPMQWLNSNLNVRFFAKLTQLQKNSMVFLFEHQFLSPDAKTDLKIKADTVVIDDFTSFCEDQGSFVLVPMSAIQVTESTARIESDRVMGTVEGQLLSDKRGFKYFCSAAGT